MAAETRAGLLSRPGASEGLPEEVDFNSQNSTGQRQAPKSQDYLGSLLPVFRPKPRSSYLSGP